MSLVAPTIRVLLVDDHRTMLWGLENLIQGQSPKMSVAGTASNCDDALERASTLLPDVILLDLDLGGRSSLEILPTLVANGVSRVLILTGVRDNGILDTAVKQGARGILRKEAPADQVLKAIEKVHHGQLWFDSDILGRIFNHMMTPAALKKLDVEAQKRATLTVKERRIIEAVVAGSGAPNKILAEQLFISEHTLRNHLSSIYQKVGVGNRLELYVYAMRHEMGPPMGPQMGPPLA